MWVGIIALERVGFCMGFVEFWKVGPTIGLSSWFGLFREGLAKMG